MEEPILDRMGTIRSFVNAPRRKAHLMKDSGKFNQLISCLDTVEDAEMAVSLYKESEEFEFGNGYLYVYGLMQAFILQQDAVSFLGDAVMNHEINFNELYPEIKTIRKIRNTTIGHPTKNHYELFAQIVRAELTKSSMIALFWSDTNGCVREEIDISQLIEDQKTCIMKELDNLIKLLEDDEKKHKEKWKENKLMNHFSQILNYHFEKMYVLSENDKALAKVSISQISKMIDTIRNDLKERLVHLELHSYPDYLFERFEKLIPKYEELLTTENIESFEFEVYADNLEKHINKLREYCQELDDYYNE